MRRKTLTRDQLVFSLPAALAAALLLPAASFGQAATPAPAPGHFTPAALKAMQTQIQALEREEDTRTPTQARLDSHLWYELKQRRGLPVADGIRTMATGVKTDAEDKVEVDVDAQVTPALLAKIRVTGADVVNSFPQYHTLRALVYVKDMETLAGLPGVRFIRPAVQPQLESPRRSPSPAQPLVPRLRARRGRAKAVPADVPGLDPLFDRLADLGLSLVAPPTQNVGSVTDEGDVAERANLARSTFNVDGTGVMVGVISDSDRYAPQAVQTGDIPADFKVLSINGVSQDGYSTDKNGAESDTGEGTAMMEIIHHLAPGAKIMFATDEGGPAAYASNVQALFNAGCRIIVDDVFYPSEDPFQDDVAARGVNAVTAQGCLYFSSAANSGNLDDSRSGVWEGDFTPSGTDYSNGETMNSFGSDPNGNPVWYDLIAAGGGEGGDVNLFWADPLGQSGNDYNLYVFDPNGNLIASSVNVQNGTQDPYEHVDGLATSGNSVEVTLHSGANRFLHLDVGRDTLNYATSGTTRGHSCAADAFNVAATPAAAAQAFSDTGQTIPGSPTGPYPGTFSGSNLVELFTSDGPRQVFFSPDGSAITPGNFSSTGGAIRNKPDFTAADGTSTSLTAAAVGANAPENFSPFFGTSAAAPHAAAIAALMLSRNPGLTLAQVQKLLTGSCIDIMAKGYDRDSGAGILDAYTAVQAAGVGTGGGAPVTHLLWDNKDGKAAFWNVDGQGNVLGVAAFGPFSDGASLWHVTALATGPDGVSHLLWNNPDGHVALWSVTDSGAVTGTTGFGPYTDGGAGNVWSAKSLSVGPDGILHLLWTNTDRKAAFWDVTPSGSVTNVTGFGPYFDGGGTQNPWIAFSVSTGPDNVSHLLWANTDGKAAFWTLGAGGSIAALTGYGPYTDGSASSLWYGNVVSTGPDNVSHLLWNNVDAKAAFWSLGGNGSVSSVSGYGPFADGSSAWHAAALSTGPDGVSRLLWNNPDGKAALWSLNGSGGVAGVTGYGPYTDGSPQNTWSAVGVSAGP